MQTQDFAISLDLVNRHYQEPNRNRYESRYFWEQLYPLIATAGFSAIEIPYEPVWQFGGRSGVPFNRYCVNTKYGDAAGYRAALAERGIARVSGITFDPNLFMRNANLDFFFGASGHFAGEALAHAAEMGADYFAISPSPYYGRALHYHPDLEAQREAFTARTVDLLAGLAAKAQDLGVALVLRNEYWSLFRGEAILPLLAALPDGVKLDVDTASLQIAGVAPADEAQARRLCAAIFDRALSPVSVALYPELWSIANRYAEVAEALREVHAAGVTALLRSEEHTSELQSH